VGSGFSATPHRPRRLLSQFSLTAVGGAFDELNLLNADGFKEIKHIEISELARVVGSAVPEPSTWALNVTVPEDNLERIDRFADEHGYTRSGFLLHAAKREIETA